jgi:hypothetical protein
MTFDSFDANCSSFDCSDENRKLYLLPGDEGGSSVEDLSVERLPSVDFFSSAGFVSSVDFFSSMDFSVEDFLSSEALLWCRELSFFFFLSFLSFSSFSMSSAILALMSDRDLRWEIGERVCEVRKK